MTSSITEVDVSEFRVEEPRDISTISLTSARVCGKTFQNRQVPYKYKFLVASGQRDDGRRVYHSGIAIEGDFTIGSRYEYKCLLAERWQDAVTVRLYLNHADLLLRFQGLTVNGVPLDDMNETAAFTSRAPADVLTKHVQNDLRKNLRIGDLPTDRERAMRVLSDPTTTNCIIFATLGGVALGGERDAQRFQTACFGVLSTFNQ